MDKFLANYKLLKFSQDEIGNSNSPITIKEIEFAIKTLLQRSLQAKTVYRIPQILKEELTLNLHNLCQKIEEKSLPKSLHEASITLISKPETEGEKSQYL